MAIRVRILTDEERRTIEDLSHSRTAAARVVERAKIIWHCSQGLRVPAVAQRVGLHAAHEHEVFHKGDDLGAVAQRVGLHEQTVRYWLQRFNAQGLEGLQDRPRPGKPPTYTPKERSEVIVAALTNPQDLQQPFACWTLDRLQVYLNEEKGIGIKRSRIDEILIAEGLRWRAQETWFSEKAVLAPDPTKEDRPLDPAFAEKRGPSRRSIPALPKAAP